MATKRRKIVTTIYLDPGQLDDLGKLAELDSTNRSIVIRQALGEYLERRKDEIPPKPDYDSRQQRMFGEDIR